VGIDVGGIEGDAPAPEVPEPDGRGAPSAGSSPEVCAQPASSMIAKTAPTPTTRPVTEPRTAARQSRGPALLWFTGRPNQTKARTKSRH
jgi:hypothetical protein